MLSVLTKSKLYERIIYIFSASSATHDNCWWIGGWRTGFGSTQFAWLIIPQGDIGRLVPFSFTDWDYRNGQPDNNYAREAYVQICKYRNKRNGREYMAWNDNAANHRANYLCEKWVWFYTHHIKTCLLNAYFDTVLENKNKSIWCAEILRLLSFFHCMQDILKSVDQNNSRPAT